MKKRKTENKSQGPALKKVSGSGRGGRREGAGRKPKGEKAGPSHLKREPLDPRYPALITWQIKPGLCDLRTRRCFAQILESFIRIQEQFPFRIVHYSAQNDHLHLLVEGSDNRLLSRSMQGLSIRIAKAINREIGRKGKIFADRYRSLVLKTPSEVRRGIECVLKDVMRHNRGKKVFPPGWVDPFSSAVFFFEPEITREETPRQPQKEDPKWIAEFLRLRAKLGRWEVSPPKTALLRAKWRKAGDIDRITIPEKK